MRYTLNFSVLLTIVLIVGLSTSPGALDGQEPPVDETDGNTENELTGSDETETQPPEEEIDPLQSFPRQLRYRPPRCTPPAQE